MTTQQIRDILDRVSLSAKDYGAKGDGVTDDAPAIQRAVDVAALVSVMPNLLKIAEAVAAEGTCYDSCHDGGCAWICTLCGGGGDGTWDDGATVIVHEPGCVKLLAQRLVGGT
jgi:hypothetical protein